MFPQHSFPTFPKRHRLPLEALPRKSPMLTTPQSATSPPPDKTSTASAHPRGSACIFGRSRRQRTSGVRTRRVPPAVAASWCDFESQAMRNTIVRDENRHFVSLQELFTCEKISWWIWFGVSSLSKSTVPRGEFFCPARTETSRRQAVPRVVDYRGELESLTSDVPTSKRMR